MPYIVSVSSFGIESEEFAKNVQNLVDPSVPIHPLEWQLKGGPQKLMDMLDTRSGQEVIVKVANQLIEHIQLAQEQKLPFYLISQKSGSRIAEEAMSMVKGIENLIIKVRHVMLAPEINGSDWKSIGKYAASALMMGVAGLALTKGSGKRGMMAAALGLIGGAALANRDTVSDKMKVKDPEKLEESPKFVNIERHVFYNPENSSFDLITEHLTKGTFYKGVYEIDDIVSLEPEHLDLEFNVSKWMRTETRLKGEIIKSLLK